MKKIFEVYYKGGYIGRVEAKTAAAALRKARYEWGSSGDYRDDPNLKKMTVRQLGQLHGNPRRVRSNSTTLHNLASVKITRNRDGTVGIVARRNAAECGGAARNTRRRNSSADEWGKPRGRYRAFEHANDRYGDGKRWYVALENDQGFHGQPQYGGTMSRSQAEAEAQSRNRSRKR